MNTTRLKIQQLHLRDYRCFSALDIDFHPELTAIIAMNGAGKTSVLDAVAVALGTYVGAFSEGQRIGFVPSDIRQTRVRNTNSLEMEYASEGVWLEAVGTVPGTPLQHDASPVTWQRSLSGPTKAKTTVKDAKVLTDYGKLMQSCVRTGSDVTLPLLAYYGTGRLWQQKKLTEGKSTSGALPRTSRTTGYTDCLDPASNYKAFEAWFHYWNINAKEGQLKAFEQGLPHTGTEFDGYISAVAGAVNTCLAPSQWGNISYSFTQKSLVAQHPEHGELPVAQLSDGIRNMIGMVADMAFRAVKLNPQLGGNAALETPGIVMIDEVDMHLHPEWQQVVLQGLNQAFPLVQFIVTTHSPQVISSIPKERVRLLGPGADGQTLATIPLSDTYGMPSHRVLERVMHVNPQPPVHEMEDLNELTRLVGQGQGESARAVQLMQVLLSKLGQGHDHLQKLQRSTERQRHLRDMTQG
jgi:predicted ATP-binding protein involved in virulence